jgi:hypothetical protein
MHPGQQVDHDLARRCKEAADERSSSSFRGSASRDDLQKALEAAADAHPGASSAAAAAAGAAEVREPPPPAVKSLEADAGGKLIEKEAMMRGSVSWATYKVR